MRRKYANMLFILSTLLFCTNLEARTVEEYASDAVQRQGKTPTFMNCLGSTYFTIECKVSTATEQLFVVCQKIDDATNEYNCMVVTF